MIKNKIIDTHVHYGEIGPFSMKLDQLMQMMDENKINIGIISTIECSEYYQDKDELLPVQIPQLKANQKLLNHVKNSKGHLYQAFWCKPTLEQNYKQVYTFISKNRKWIKGMKFHPYYSRLALEDKGYHVYIDIARQLDLPISVHTANDDLSNPNQLLTLARKYPTVDFIMVHMGLGTDNELATKCLSKADNLYGDTTWVPFDKVIKATKICGSEKMMFGSDASIDGDKSYEFYKDIFEYYRAYPTPCMDNIMYKNAQRIFKLEK